MYTRNNFACCGDITKRNGEKNTWIIRASIRSIKKNLDDRTNVTFSREWTYITQHNDCRRCPLRARWRLYLSRGILQAEITVDPDVTSIHHIYTYIFIIILSAGSIMRGFLIIDTPVTRDIER